jgi:hypothetical protein
MIQKNWVGTPLAAIGMAAGGMLALFIWHEFSDKTSAFSMFRLEFASVPTLEQQTRNLTEKLRTSPMLPQLQPWALTAIRRFRDGQVQTNGGNTLAWENDAVLLAPSEMPNFVRTHLAETTRLGDLLPAISIVLTNKQPNYVALDFGSYGIAVGATNYQLSFDPDWDYNLAPGVYTYGLQWAK